MKSANKSLGQELKESLTDVLEYERLRSVAHGIDWDQQYASQYYIGEDAAHALLTHLGFDFNEGVSNESVEAFLASKREGGG